MKAWLCSCLDFMRSAGAGSREPVGSWSTNTNPLWGWGCRAGSGAAGWPVSLAGGTWGSWGTVAPSLASLSCLRLVPRKGNPCQKEHWGSARLVCLWDQRIPHPQSPRSARLLRGLSPSSSTPAHMVPTLPCQQHPSCAATPPYPPGLSPLRLPSLPGGHR